MLLLKKHYWALMPDLFLLRRKTPYGQDLPTLPNGISNLDFSWRRVGGGIPLKLITYFFIKKEGADFTQGIL